MLRHLVELNDGIYRPSLKERALLAYYANAIAHLLAPADEVSLPHAAGDHV
jgi:hypothetical protein